MSSENVPCLKVKQWLDSWDDVKWDPSQNRAKPPTHFYQFSMSATTLKALSGVQARTTKQRKRGKDDPGIQRRHEVARSDEIASFVKSGFPWSELGERKRSSGKYDDIKMPGWLPTSIVINIRKPNDQLRGRELDPDDCISIADTGKSISEIVLPKNFTGREWKPKGLRPIEIIDGQHRLWAFEDKSLPKDFELPVVAFYGLDRSWQAYLFYTINIKPKKINASLAYDLYPLLRSEEWLSRLDGPAIYRETRAQELVDLLWSHPKSPWYERINMLGESGQRGRMVSQSAWIKTLLSSFIKSWVNSRAKAGGLFGNKVGEDGQVLQWNRFEQAAFLITAGNCLKKKIDNSLEDWVEHLEKPEEPTLFGDETTAFTNKNNLLNQDQGLRVFMQIVNDCFFLNCDDLALDEWGDDEIEEDDDLDSVSAALKSLKKENGIIKYLEDLAGVLATYDWRASSTPDLPEELRVIKAGYRGSGGYKELKLSVLKYMEENSEEDLQETSVILLGGS